MCTTQCSAALGSLLAILRTTHHVLQPSRHGRHVWSVVTIPFVFELVTLTFGLREYAFVLTVVLNYGVLILRVD